MICRFAWWPAIAFGPAHPGRKAGLGRRDHQGQGPGPERFGQGSGNRRGLDAEPLLQAVEAFDQERDGLARSAALPDVEPREGLRRGRVGSETPDRLGGKGHEPTRTYLAHSGFELRLSTMASFRPDGTHYDGIGVEPDRVVMPLPTDFLVGGTDSVLEAALDFLR